MSASERRRRLLAPARGAVRFARLSALAASLRAGGVGVRLRDVLAAHRALRAVAGASPAETYSALSRWLCPRPADQELFDAAFAICFGSPGRPPPTGDGRRRHRAAPVASRPRRPAG